MDAALTATRMLKFWVEGWIEDPEKSPGDIVDWLSYLPSRDAATDPASGGEGEAN